MNSDLIEIPPPAGELPPRITIEIALKIWRDHVIEQEPATKLSKKYHFAIDSIQRAIDFVRFKFYSNIDPGFERIRLIEHTRHLIATLTAQIRESQNHLKAIDEAIKSIKEAAPDKSYAKLDDKQIKKLAAFLDQRQKIVRTISLLSSEIRQYNTGIAELTQTKKIPVEVGPRRVGISRVEDRIREMDIIDLEKLEQVIIEREAKSTQRQLPDGPQDESVRA
jgi:hypothetical protein